VVSGINERLSQPPPTAVLRDFTKLITSKSEENRERERESVLSLLFSQKLGSYFGVVISTDLRFICIRTVSVYV
jgi:hypothetical protein